MMKPLIPLLLLLAHCMITPGDGRRVANAQSSIGFQGFGTEPNITVTIKALNMQTNTWAVVGTTTTSATPSQHEWGTDWYGWSKSLTLPQQYWTAGTNGGHRARVKSSNPVDGEHVSLRTDFATCFNENRGDLTEFAHNCVSHRYPNADIYTNAYQNGPPNCAQVPTGNAPYNLNSIPACRQSYISQYLSQFITHDVVVAHHEIAHGEPDSFFDDHRKYIRRAERHMMVLGDKWVPDGTLPYWRGGAAEIPSAFASPKEPPQDCNSLSPGCTGWMYQPFEDLDPSEPLPSSLVGNAICNLNTKADLHGALNGWHGNVHIAIGGTFATFDSPGAMLFFPWHKYVDTIYQRWLDCP